MAEQALTDGQSLDATDVAATAGDQNDAGLPPDSASSGDDAARARALALGWQDKDEFVNRGKREADWADYDEFLRVHDRVLPITRKENKKLERQLQARDAELAALRQQVEAMQKQFGEQQQARGQIEESALMGERERALEQGNYAEVNRIDKRLREISAPPAPKAPETPAQPQVDPRVKAVLEDFGEDNPTYQNNQQAQNALAVEVATIKSVNPGLGMRETLDAAHDRVRRLYPEFFAAQPAAPRRNAAPMAEMNTTPSRGGARGKSWSDLKPEVAQALDTWIDSEPMYQKLGRDKARAKILANATADQFRSR